jgi:hypothetical protein
MLAVVNPDLEHDLERALTAPSTGGRRAAGRGNGPERAAHDLGNRGFTQFVARMQDGEGILPNGTVHPDVEAAIAASQGTGRRLDSGLADSLGRSFGDSLHDVRIHADDHAAALARAVSARAFTVGSDIFFGTGEYNPGSPDGARLIAHEAAHVVQQRGAPMSGPLLVSQPGDAMEREAEALASDLAG